MTAAVSSAAATWNDERFQCNVAALQALQPELARRMADLKLPDTVEPAWGRDGTPTFRILGTDRRRHWLGRTSMPSISAPAAVEHFDMGGANALIPLVATGFEADLLCKRIGRHVAVFAHDADPVNVKLALHVTDLAEHFRDGRLVLLTFGPIEETLPAFLAEHPGYDFPHRMLVHPAVGQEALDRLRAGSEAAASAAADRRFQRARAVAAAMAGEHRPSLGDRPRVTVLASDPRGGPMATVEQLVRALAELDWPAAVQAPSSPDQCHDLARLILICDHRPDLILTFNSCAGRLTEFIPPDWPVASWFWPGSAVGPAVGAGYGHEHHMFAATPALCEQLRDAGVVPDRVHLLEIGVDASCYKPIAVDPERRSLLACDAAVLVDAVDASAAAAGIKHPSQVALWQRIHALTTRRAREYTSSLAPQIVSQAERATGTKMTSQDVREKFVHLLHHRLAPTAVVRAAVVALRRAGVSVKVWGRGWGGDDAVGDVVVGPIPDACGRNEISQCATTVVSPRFDASAAQAILEVTAAGGRAVFTPPETDLPTLHPTTAEVFNLLPQYGDFGTLVSRVREAGVSKSQHSSNVAAARRCVMARHSLAHRWLALRDALRRGG